MLNNNQQKIYEGLKNVGESIANFFLDAVEMTSPDCKLLSKANFIAHAAREIDGGLRDVFAPDKIAKEFKKILSNSEEDKVGHFASILAAVGNSDPNNSLAIRWHRIAKNFHHITHRKQIHSSSVDAGEILSLWEEYEEVLLVVIGSFLSLTNRLDVLLSLDEPQLKSLPAINNILNNSRHAEYFFSRLNKVGWLYPLDDNEYFSPSTAPKHISSNDLPEYWYPIKYLFNISSICRRNIKIKLISIIEEIMLEYINGNLGLHPYTISDILQILVNVEDFTLGDKEMLFIERYDSNTQKGIWSFIPSILIDGFAPKFTEKVDIQGLENLLNYFFGFKSYEDLTVQLYSESSKPYIRIQPNVDDHDIDQLLSKHGTKILEILGPSAIKIVMIKLEELEELIPNSLMLSFPITIEPTSQSFYSHRWEAMLVDFIRDNAVKLEFAKLDELLDEMLSSKAQILHRIAIHIIRENFETLNVKWWKYISNKKINTSIYIHEPYILIKQHSKRFSDKQFKEVIDWIEGINAFDIERNNLPMDVIGYTIRRWLTALEPNSENSRILLENKSTYYSQFGKETMTDHPEFDSYSTSTYGFEYPMRLSEFQNLSIDEQIDFIERYNPEYPSDITKEGLAELIKLNVSADPGKYLYSLEKFLHLESVFLKYLLDGFTIVLKRNDLNEFSLVLSLIEKRLFDSVYAKPDEIEIYKKWFAWSISEFVSNVAAKDDQLNLNEVDINRVIVLLISMLDIKVFQDDSESIKNGYINHVLNSIPGRLYMALLEFSRIGADKFSSDMSLVKWPIMVQEHFSRKLPSRDSKDKDFSIVLGIELHLIEYLDINWVEENINLIFDQSNIEHYSYRLHAVFSRYYKLSINFYKFLKQHAIFQKALDHFNNESEELETVMIYGLYEWKFWEGDPEQNSIINEIFIRNNPSQIKQLVNTTWKLNLLSPDEVIYLWKRLIVVFERVNELSPHYSMLLLLFSHITELSTEVFDITKLVLEKTIYGRDIYTFLRHLYTISGSNLELSGELVLQVYKTKLAMLGLEDKLKILVEKLFESGLHQLANAICIEVSEQGSLILKELYNKYN